MANDRRSEASLAVSLSNFLSGIRLTQNLTRIIHQPKKPTNEGTWGSRMRRKTAVSQEHHPPKTRASGCAGPVPIGLRVALRPKASWQPPPASHTLFARRPSTRSTALHRTCEGARTHAHQCQRCLTTGATGHDEGNALVLRSSPSCPRAPRLRPRHGSVALVAAAHWVLLKTSRRHVARHPEAAACHNTRHGVASTR